MTRYAHPLDEPLPMEVLRDNGMETPFARPSNWPDNWLDQLLTARVGEWRRNTGFSFLSADGSVQSTLETEQLMQAALEAAGAFRALAPKKSRILLVGGNTPEFLIGFFGALYADCIPVSGVNPVQPGAVQRMRHILRDCEADLVFGSRADLGAFQPLCRDANPKAKWLPAESAKGEILFDPWRGSRKETVFVQYSSGTNGAPRGVVLSHINIQENLVAQMGSLGFIRLGPGLSWLPFTHDMGLLGGPLLALTLGERLYVQRPEDFTENPMRWINAVADYGISFSGAPAFAYKAVVRQYQSSPKRDKQLDLSAWKGAAIGAEPVRPEIAREFADTFARHGFDAEIYRPCYGMAETSLMVAGEIGLRAYDFSRKSLALGRAVPPESAGDCQSLVSIGRVVKDHEIRIVSESDEKILPSGEIGEIWCAGPSVAQSYVGTSARYGAPCAFVKDEAGRNWFRTGDRGFFFDDKLFVLGRVAENLALPKGRFEPSDLSALIGAHAVIERKGVLIAVVEGNEKSDVSRETRDMARKLADITGMKRVRILRVRVGRIPRTPSGKLRLNALKESFDDLKPWHAYTTTDEIGLN